jgi:hypothetical protein
VTAAEAFAMPSSEPNATTVVVRGMLQRLNIALLRARRAVALVT